jgi:hypothetical protein
MPESSWSSRCDASRLTSVTRLYIPSQPNKNDAEVEGNSAAAVEMMISSPGS